MSAEAKLYAALAAHAPLVALVGDRIYPDAMPEDATYPVAIFSRVATDPTYSISGDLLCEDVTLQVSCFAENRGAADAVADAACTALRNDGEKPAGRESGFDAETGLYGASFVVDLLMSA